MRRHVFEPAHFVGIHKWHFSSPAHGDAVGLIPALQVAALQGRRDVLHKEAFAHRPQLAVDFLRHGREVPLQRVADKADTLRFDAAAPACGLVGVAHHVWGDAENAADFLYREQACRQNLSVFAVDGELCWLQSAGQDQRAARAVLCARAQRSGQLRQLLCRQLRGCFQGVVKIGTTGKKLPAELLRRDGCADGFARGVGDGAGAGQAVKTQAGQVDHVRAV